MEKKKKILESIRDFFLLLFVTLFAFSVFNFSWVIHNCCWYRKELSPMGNKLPTATINLIKFLDSNMLVFTLFFIAITNVILFILFITKLKENENIKLYIVLFEIVIFLLIFFYLLGALFVPFACI